MSYTSSVFYIILYLIAGMSFISSVWIYQGMKRLTSGDLKNLFKHLFMISLWGFLYVSWNFSLLTGILRFPGFLSPEIPIALFIVQLFMIICSAAMCAKDIGGRYGFK